MLKKAMIAGSILFTVAAMPGDCADGCILNCICRGGEPILCEGICQDTVCFASVQKIDTSKF